MVIDDDRVTKGIVVKRPESDLIIREKHYIKDMGSIRNAQEYKSEESETVVLNGHVEKKGRGCSSSDSVSVEMYPEIDNKFSVMYLLRFLMEKS